MREKLAGLSSDKKRIACLAEMAAGLLSNTQRSSMDISPSALISTLQARPFNTTFARQMNTARSLYGTQLIMLKLATADIREFCSRF